MVSGTDIQKIPGHAKVIYSEDGESVQVIVEPISRSQRICGDNYDDLRL